jgi:hypothetical protein
MSGSPDRPSSSPYRCRDCGSEVGFRSRRRTWTERFRRDYRLIFTPVRDRLSDTPRIIPGKQTPASDRNVA